MSTATKPREKSRTGRNIAAVAIAAIAVLAVAAHLAAAGLVLGVLITLAVAVVRLRLWWIRCSSSGWIASWRRRRFQGAASWAELRRRAFRPQGGGVPICTVTRGRTR